MALTKKELLKFLDMFQDDDIITNQQNEDFIHMVNTNSGNIILSTQKPIGICNRTSTYVYPSIVKGYHGFCPELGEDLYYSEFTKLQNNGQ